MRRWVTGCLAIPLLLGVALPPVGARAAAEPEARERLQAIYTPRARSRLDGEAERIKPLYDAEGGAASGWALDHGVRKLRYVQHWAERRGLYFVEATPALRLISVRKRGEALWVYLHQTLALGDDTLAPGVSPAAADDPEAYPAGLQVNAHTADRYRSPWDLGWDRRTLFWLIRVDSHG